ncbi:hypothetical protein ACH9L7_08705 [Haloferax sp. S1W]|uniref:hypothetical protein n=1 Tax=Haloferax sp. S1W TaxID=3377110 RepID=UPI0037C8042B
MTFVVVDKPDKDQRFIIHDYERTTMAAIELPGRSEAWLTAAATLGGYSIILVGMFVVLFVLPFVVASSL